MMTCAHIKTLLLITVEFTVESDIYFEESHVFFNLLRDCVFFESPLVSKFLLINTLFTIQFKIQTVTYQLYDWYTSSLNQND